VLFFQNIKIIKLKEKSQTKKITKFKKQLVKNKSEKKCEHQKIRISLCNKILLSILNVTPIIIVL